MTAPRHIDRRTAGELVRLERKVIQIEATEAWERVHRLGQITHYGATYGPIEWAEQAGAELQTIAARQLRMLAESGGDCA